MRSVRLGEIDREYVMVPEVMQILGLSKNSVYRLLHAGAIPALRVGRKFVIPRLALERLLADPAAVQRMQQDDDRAAR
ncbi:MAG: helix-turn-helix domain-containing protein [Limnochordaceae bacterium]|nr:helix-turn-helix domain-containing protein [Limnochordaceae bacterium]